MLRDLLRAYPTADFTYYADTARAPFGEKSHAELVRIAEDAVEHFRGMDALVLACNTTSVLLSELTCDYPVFGISPPVIDDGKSTLILATPFTVSRLCAGRGLPPHTLAVGVAELVPLVEQEAPVTDEVLPRLRELLPRGDFERVVLGCTHYPFLAGQIGKLYPRAELVSGVQKLLRELGCALPQEKTQPRGSVAFEFSKGELGFRYATLLESLFQLS